MKNLAKYFILALLIFSLAGCEKFFNPDSDGTLLEEDYIGKFTELYAGYMGINAKVQAVADKAVFIEGLRGDFLEPTIEAPQDIWDIYNYTDNLNNNELADPKGYYAVIMNANDYIEHAIEYKVKNPNALPVETYNALIGGAIRYKVWAYLMLAKIYGEAYYFDGTVKQYQDINNFPKFTLDQIIDKCIQLMETGVQGIDGKGTVKWSVLLFPGQNVTSTETQWDRICPTPESLLAELYLWKGDYQKCWDYCVAQIVAGKQDGDNYLISLSEYGNEWVKISRSFVRQEHVAAAFYDYELKQTNRVITYFSNKFPNVYYMRPTQVAMDRFLNQKNEQGSFGDFYRGLDKTFKLENGQWVVWKFISDAHSSADKIYKSNLHIPLYRASDIHLMLIEALGGLNRYVEAYHILNKGFIVGANCWNPTTQSFNPPFDKYPSVIYRSSNEGYMQGIRGRVSTGNNHLVNVGTYLLDANTSDSAITAKHYKLDSLIVEELCLESAGESRSYYAMVRAARRWGTDARKMWAAKVAAKYPGGGEAIRQKLEANIENWFIKYDLSK